MVNTTLNFVTFNQDHSCLAVGTSHGFRIYHTEPFSKIFSSNDGNIAIIEMLFSTSLVAFILSPRHLIIQNTKGCLLLTTTISGSQRASVICELTFPHAVLAIRLNRKRLAVVLEEEIYLYDISNMTLLYTIPTSPNPLAICALSPSSDSCYIAYPLPKPRDDSVALDRRPSHSPPPSAYVAPTTGHLLVFDTLSLKAVNVVEAHRSPLSCIALNSEGTILATASETGTIIRVFSLPHGQKLYQFRRGTYPSTIYSMSFNLPSTLLCVSSASDTVHIFRLAASSPSSPTSSRLPLRPDHGSRTRTLDSNGGSSNNNNLDADPDPSTNSTTSFPPFSAHSSPQSVADSVDRSAQSASPSAHKRQSGSFGSMLRRSSQIMGRGVAGVVGSYLPQTVTEMWEPLRDFAHIKIPKSSSARPAAANPNSIAASSPLAVATPAIRSVVAMSSSSPQVMVVTSDGSFYVFHIDLDNGGEGHLIKHFSVLSGDDKLDVPPYGP